MGGACPGVAGSAGVSGTRRGACLLCRLPTLPLWCPAGGVPALSPVNPALTCFPAPIPPAPFPAGRGVTIGYFMQGAAPLASPGLNPRGTGSPCRCGKLNGGLPRRCRRGGCQRYPAGGACLLCRLLTLPLTCFPAPIPPAPFPAGRGRFLVFLCKGLRPLHPRG